MSIKSYPLTYKFDELQITDLAARKKLPLLVRHGIIAVYEGTYRILKYKNGKVIRTKDRKLSSGYPLVPKSREGFILAFNFIVNRFTDLGFLKIVNGQISLSSRGRTQNTLHLRETDSTIRTLAFNRVFKKYFGSEG